MSFFQVIFSLKAAVELAKLPPDIQEQIKKKLEGAKEQPFHFFDRLKGRTDYKLRVGDYRIIADLIVSSQRIEVLKIGHRKNIYKNL